MRVLKEFCRSGTVLAAVLALPPVALAEDVTLSAEGLSLSADREVSCSEPPVFRLSGDLRVVFVPDRSAVNSLLNRMARGLTQSCDNVDTLEVEAEEGGVNLRFEIARAQNWMLPILQPLPRKAAPQAAAVPALPQARAFAPAGGAEPSAAATGPAAPQEQVVETAPAPEPAAPAASAAVAAQAGFVDIPLPAQSVDTLDTRQFAALGEDVLDRGALPLIYAMIGLRPQMADDPRLIEQLYLKEGGSFASEATKQATLDAFRGQIFAVPQPPAIRLALQHDGHIRRSAVPVEGGRITPSFDDHGPNTLRSRMELMLPQFRGQKLILTMPTLPQTFAIPVSAPQAQGMLQGAGRNDYIWTTMHSYVELTNLRYSPSLRGFTADVVYFGSELKSKVRNKDTAPPRLFARYAPQPLPPVVANAAEAMDLAQFARRFGEGALAEGEVDLSSREVQAVLTRLAVAKRLAAQPQMLEDDDTALALAEALLTPRERDLLWKDFDRPDQIRALSPFDKRDLAQQIRGPFRPRLMSSNARLPVGFKEVIPTTLGPYDFENGHFPLNYKRDDGFRTNGHDALVSFGLDLRAVVLPKHLSADEAQARQMDAYLRERGDGTLYLVMRGQIEEMTSAATRQGTIQMSARTGGYSVVLYADAALTQPILDYSAILASAQEQRLADQAAYNLPMSRRSQILRDIDEQADIDLVKLVSERLRFQRQVSPTQQRALIAEAALDLAAAEPAEHYRFAGRIEFGPYDADSGTVPVTNMTYGLSGSSGAFPYDVRFDMPLSGRPERLKVTPEQAARLVTDEVHWLRLNASLAGHRIETPEGHKPGITAELALRRLEVFSNSSEYGGAEIIVAVDY